jgi:hypothetical protein
VQTRGLAEEGKCVSASDPKSGSAKVTQSGATQNKSREVSHKP